MGRRPRPLGPVGRWHLARCARPGVDVGAAPGNARVSRARGRPANWTRLERPATSAAPRLRIHLARRKEPAPSCGFTPGHSSHPGPIGRKRAWWRQRPAGDRFERVAPSHRQPGFGAAVTDRPANRRPWRRPGYRSLSQGRRQPRRLQVRDRPGRAGPSLRCTGSRSRTYSSRSPSPRAMSRRSLRSAKNRRRGGGCSRTHSVYMNCLMHQHAPDATRPATSVHHKTANTSHSAFSSCCHAGPYGFQYLTSPTSNPGGRTGHHDHPVRSGKVHPTPKYIGGKG